MSEWLDKGSVRRAFSKAASRYDKVAVLQREIGQRMLDRLNLVRLKPATVLDLGAGTGVATVALEKIYPKAQVIALDFAFPMLQQTRRRGGLFRKPSCLCADLEQLPLADASVDLIYSNAAIQWCNDLDRVFPELQRVLRPGGLLMFTTFGPDTLQELRAAWSEADGYAHVSRFLDMHDIGDALMRAQFSDPVMDVDRMTLTYSAVEELMRELKILGAHNVASGRQRALTGKGRLIAMKASYEQFRRNGLLPASYEVVYGHAWAPLQSQQSGVTLVSLDRIGRRPA
ncbi:MAG: malonyl-ACP O-methyltransferase BioC [Gammaproteobacteria bacterium]|nr:malonyl-ACP O-methyltransferase BioC [Gammaproteobacteria bacterium]MCB1863472.1 malonyl-ACP O-methyltransferase BioC [Gammaproteobacteria bacterium]MCB1904195.1 malonyl-ACP O-methyltransferase BioC [Gammaproteobacteria bacterium]